MRRIFFLYFFIFYISFFWIAEGGCNYNVLCDVVKPNKPNSPIMIDRKLRAISKKNEDPFLKLFVGTKWD